eukprot:sb/3461744/
MKYFAEYLATDVKHCEEVDISVHCDVQIFDWLMRYVQRDKSLPPDDCVPKLEPTNVISILISSDFLKMTDLVGLCVQYCHSHISEIIAAPCNMNCISGQILTDIARLFTIREIEAIRDRKDKFKSKLYAKKVEFLIESASNSQDIFRCSSCRRILSSHLQSKVPCVTGRMTIGYNGVLRYSHSKDVMFDVSEFLIHLRQSGKNWCDVYWYLWSALNYLTCVKCQHIFSLNEYYDCLHHPELPDSSASVSGAIILPEMRKYTSFTFYYFTVFKEGEDQISAAVGVYPCCGQRALRFDPLTCPQGCEKMKHTVSMVPGGEHDPEKSSDTPANLVQLFEEHEELITNSNDGDKTSQVPCVTGRMTIGYNGVLRYSHSKDVMFDVSEFLIHLRQSGKNWCDVYWYLWSALNYLTCVKCQHIFSLNEYYDCLHHPELPDSSASVSGAIILPEMRKYTSFTFYYFTVFKEGEDQISAAVGVYPCCGQRALRFDPLTCPQGCEKMKHTVSMVPGGEHDPEKSSDTPANLVQLFEEHEELITNSNDGDKTFPLSEYNMFLYEELACGIAKSDKLEKQSSLGSLTNPNTDGDSESIEGIHPLFFFFPPVSTPNPPPPGIAEDEDTEEEEVTQIIKKRQGANRTRKTRGRVRSRQDNSATARVPDRTDIYVESVSSDGSKVMGGGDYASSKMRWDSRRSRRWNQDAQRDDDKLRTGELVSQLNNLKIQMKRTDITKQRETHPGGLYYLLENRFRSSRTNQNKETGKATSSAPIVSLLKPGRRPGSGPRYHESGASRPSNRRHGSVAGANRSSNRRHDTAAGVSRLSTEPRNSEDSSQSSEQETEQASPKIVQRKRRILKKTERAASPDSAICETPPVTDIVPTKTDTIEVTESLISQLYNRYPTLESLHFLVHSVNPNSNGQYSSSGVMGECNLVDNVFRHSKDNKLTCEGIAGRDG